MKLILMHVGRIFLALYFLIPGISKFTSWNTSVALMEAHNMKMIPIFIGNCWHSTGSWEHQFIIRQICC